MKNLLRVLYMGVMPMLCVAMWIMLYSMDKFQDSANLFLISLLSLLCTYIAWAVWFITKPYKA